MQFQFEAEAGDCLELTVTDFGEVAFTPIFLVSSRDRSLLTGWQAGKALATFDFATDMAIVTKEMPERSFTIKETGTWVVATKLPGGSVRVLLKKPNGDVVPVPMTQP